MKWAIALGLVVLLGLGIPLSADASICRQLEGHQVCILRIKRSAKYFWEYRAVVSIDGEKRPWERYNCRDRRRIGTDDLGDTLQANELSGLVCDLVSR